MPTASLLILVAVLLPPKALDLLGPVIDERTLLTPYGEAGPLALRQLPGGAAAWVQPYTGLPTRTDPRATIYAARQLGITRILNWDMGIALNPVLQRGEPVIVNDYIAWISHQSDTFFATSPVEMDASATGLRTSFCPELVAALRRMIPGAPEAVTLGADFLRRETPAEARMFRAWGADVLTYNLVPEVTLAQEMGLCYAGLATISAMATDRSAPPATGEVRASLHALAELLPEFVTTASAPRACRCGALVTG
jgi:5'-methylthioadenosine phosphorylase